VSYVLVSLLGDAATEANDAFAQWFAALHPPSQAFHGEHPDHDVVAAAVRATPLALVLGHDGGGSVRGAAEGAAWADPEQFARIFAGARVWVYACLTRGERLEDDLESFGRRARGAGVAVFAGHARPINAVLPFVSFPEPRTVVYQALARAFRAFLQGENNARALQRAALRGTSSGRPTVLIAPWIQRDMESLRVLA
jgi:hypothetical protein